MTISRTSQRHLSYRGRDFHFVCYEGTPANPRRGLEAVPAMWCLMAAGKRWTVMPLVPDQAEADLEHRLHDWLDTNVFPPAA